MAARYEVELVIASARNLKNVNWRHGDLKPYVVAWVDPAAKSSTKVAVGGDDDDPIWDDKLVFPVPYGLPLEDATLSLDVVHAGSGEEGVKPLVASVRLPLRDVLDEVGLGSKLDRTLKLKRPSGRPQGKLQVTVAVKEPARYYDSYAPPYGQASSRDYGYAPPPLRHGADGPPVAYGQEEKSKSKFGMGTGLAVGAAAGLLGGLALAEGVDYVEDKIADDAAERVEDDLAEDGGYDGDDF
ncbi:hypothetical protein OPV22_000370 [Ensete ventricosum]|uniref:C2 domain-containing protein n=1 Tax=Ensete ventricosum TaxID=4639 RepID=A0AAV8RQ03_ENSVE|nr:hypothetical protein OPV22_000370 [Ensete ventricosum]